MPSTNDDTPAGLTVRSVLQLVFALTLFILPAEAQAAACIAPNNGGTADLPALGCGLETRDGPFVIEDGLPPGTTIEIEIVELDLVCSNPITCTAPPGPGICEAAGGGLGGDLQCYGSDLQLTLVGTGALAGFNRMIRMPVVDETHSGPRTPGDPVQTFQNDFITLEGAIFGDPDFDQLQIRLGSSFGLPSPGQTKLTDLGNGTWNVDSFFDVEYQIDFVGAPGSALEGLGGSTQKLGRLSLGEPIPIPVPAVSRLGLGLGIAGILAVAGFWRRRAALLRR